MNSNFLQSICSRLLIEILKSLWISSEFPCSRYRPSYGRYERQYYSPRRAYYYHKVLWFKRYLSTIDPLTSANLERSWSRGWPDCSGWSRTCCRRWFWRLLRVLRARAGVQLRTWAGVQLWSEHWLLRLSLGICSKLLRPWTWIRLRLWSGLHFLSNQLCTWCGLNDKLCRRCRKQNKHQNDIKLITKYLGLRTWLVRKFWRYVLDTSQSCEDTCHIISYYILISLWYYNIIDISCY